MMVGDIAAHAALAWIVAAIALGIAELAVPGVFLVFLAIAAAITGAATFVLPGLPPLVQLGSFAAWSIAAVLVGRRWYRDYPLTTSDPLLNDRAARLIGAQVTLETAIEDGRGRAILGDGTWPATGPDAPAGTRMRVMKVEGGVLRLEAVEPAGLSEHSPLPRSP